MVGPGPSPGLQGCPAAMRAGGSCGEVVPPPAECPVPLLQSHGYQEDQGPSSQRAGVGGRRCPFLRRTHDRRLCLTAVGTDGWLRFPVVRQRLTSHCGPSGQDEGSPWGHPHGLVPPKGLVSSHRDTRDSGIPRGAGRTHSCQHGGAGTLVCRRERAAGQAGSCLAEKCEDVQSPLRSVRGSLWPRGTVDPRGVPA